MSATINMMNMGMEIKSCLPLVLFCLITLQWPHTSVMASLITNITIVFCNSMFRRTPEQPPKLSVTGLFINGHGDRLIPAQRPCNAESFSTYGVNIVVSSWSPVNNKNLWQVSFRKQRIFSKSQDLLMFMIPAHGVAVRFLVIWATLGSDNYIHKPAVPLEINPKMMQPEEYGQPYKLYKNNINSAKQGGTKLLVYNMKLVCIAKRKPLPFYVGTYKLQSKF